MTDIITYFKLPKTIHSSIGFDEQCRDANIVKSNPWGWSVMMNMIQIHKSTDLHYLSRTIRGTLTTISCI